MPTQAMTRGDIYSPRTDWENLECPECEGGGLLFDKQCTHSHINCMCHRDACTKCAGTGMLPIPFTEL